MTRMVLRLSMLVAAAVLAHGAGDASAATIQELVRLKNVQQDQIIGYGIVVGLDGTGDRPKDMAVAARSYAELLRNLGSPVLSPRELDKVDTMAIVMVTLDIPAGGVSEGDRLDVRIAAMGNAESLEGGILVPSMLRLPLPDAQRMQPLAMASGPLAVDRTSPRTAVVRTGGQMLVDIGNDPVSADGTVSLVLHEQFAGYPMASMLADTINDVFATRDRTTGVARVVDGRTIRVVLPPTSLDDPASFLAQLLTIYIDPSLMRLEARVIINERDGIIIATDDVEITPVAVTHAGLTITTVTPSIEPTVLNPSVTVDSWAGVGTVERRGRNATRLNDLLAALNRLNVPVEDRIRILFVLKESGALHAEIVRQ